MSSMLRTCLLRRTRPTYRCLNDRYTIIDIPEIVRRRYDWNGLECVQFDDARPIVTATGSELRNLRTKFLRGKGHNVRPQEKSISFIEQVVRMTRRDVQNDLIVSRRAR